MANWTSSNLADAVLRRLNVVGAGQTPNAEDSTFITDRWPGIYEKLRLLDVAFWGREAIEEISQEPLEKYVAGLVYSHWGFTGAREQSIILNAEQGWEDLKLVASSRRTSLPVTTDDNYY